MSNAGEERGRPGVWAVRRMGEEIHATDRLTDGFARAKVRGDALNPRRESSGFSAWPDHGADLVASETGSAHDGASDQSPRTENRKPHEHQTIAGAQKDDASERAPPTCTMHACARLMRALRRRAVDPARRGGG